MTRSLHLNRIVVALGLLAILVQGCAAYSVLTHEQVVDLVWKDDIEPILKIQFPASTEVDLRKAHAFTYAGSLLQDMADYPSGNTHFSDLTHDLRTGDFIVSSIEEASALNKLGFALVALCQHSP